MIEADGYNQGRKQEHERENAAIIDANQQEYECEEYPDRHLSDKCPRARGQFKTPGRRMICLFLAALILGTFHNRNNCPLGLTQKKGLTPADRLQVPAIRSTMATGQETPIRSASAN